MRTLRRGGGSSTIQCSTTSRSTTSHPEITPTARDTLTGVRDPEVSFREARREDLPGIVGLLADDPLGSTREAPGSDLPDAYWKAFDAIEKDANNAIIVAEID